MTDKEFDSIIKDALLSEEVPPQLNRALLDKVKKKKQNKIFSFTKPATYAAAVFICAVAVLGYFNSDMPLGTETTPETAEVVSEDRDVSSDSQFNVKKEASPAEIPPEATESASGTPEVNSNAYNTQKTDVYSRKNSSNERAYVPEAKTAEKKAPQPAQETTQETTSAVSEKKQVVSENTDAVAKNKEVKIEVSSSDASFAESAAIVSENSADIDAHTESEKYDEAPLPQRARTLPGEENTESAYCLTDSDEGNSNAEPEEEPNTLSDLFTDGYDYKSTIDERVTEQIANLPHAEEYTFSGISGNESFSLNEENALTVNFDAGTIAPEEHGDQFFTVGTVENGVLK